MQSAGVMEQLQCATVKDFYYWQAPIWELLCLLVYLILNKIGRIGGLVYEEHVGNEKETLLFEITWNEMMALLGKKLTRNDRDFISDFHIETLHLHWREEGLSSANMTFISITCCNFDTESLLTFSWLTVFVIFLAASVYLIIFGTHIGPYHNMSRKILG